MPRLSPLGDVWAGIGSAVVSVNRRVVAADNAGGACALDAARGVFQIGSRLYTCTPTGTPEIITADPLGANALAAGGGVYAATFNHAARVSTDLSRQYPDWGVGDVGLDGTALLIPPDGLFQGQFIRDVQSLGGGQWSGVDGNWRPVCSAGTPNVQAPAGSIYGLRRVGAYCCYQHNARFIVAHVDKPVGLVLVDPCFEAFRPDIVQLPSGQLRVTFATGANEFPNEVWWKDVPPEALTQELEGPPAIEMPVIGRKHWLGWFEFALPPQLPPCNAMLDVTSSLLRSGGVVVAVWTDAEQEGNTEAAYAAKIAAARRQWPGIPVIAYWPYGSQTGFIPPADWIGVEAYWKNGETLGQFESRIRTAVARCPTVALVAQCYTSNASQQTDLAALVPVYARIVRDCPNIIATLPFSDYGRATGLQDHPEVRPSWQALYDGITGAPDIESGDAVNAPVVTVQKWTLDELLDGRTFDFYDSANPDLGYQVRVFVSGGSMYASMTNALGHAQTGMYRPVKPCSEPEPGPTPEPTPKQYRLRSIWGTYLTVGADAYVVQGSGDPIEFVDGGIKLRGAYVAAEPDGRCKADRGSVGDWERWTVERQGETLHLKSWQAKYLSAAEDQQTVWADKATALDWESFTLEEIVATPVTQPLRPDGRIFRVGNDPWRWKGVSAFPLARMHADGRFAEVDAFLAPFAPLGYNLLRVWDYVTWTGTGWEPVTTTQMTDFIEAMRRKGFYVELTLLTDDDAGRLPAAHALVQALAPLKPVGLVVEIGNEPLTHKNINIWDLHGTLVSAGLPYSSGLYEDTRHTWFGTYGTAHTPRDSGWPRKGHDLLEYYNGGGPSYPDEPACKVPWVGDEPIKPTDAIGYTGAGALLDYRAHGGVCALLGAGATFHFEGGKFGTPPNPDELNCARELAVGLNAFPADAPLGPYRRIDESSPDPSSRTYVVGPYMVRVRPQTPEAPESGWVPIDTDGILWRR